MECPFGGRWEGKALESFLPGKNLLAAGPAFAGSILSLRDKHILISIEYPLLEHVKAQLFELERGHIDVLDLQYFLSVLVVVCNK